MAEILKNMEIPGTQGQCQRQGDGTGFLGSVTTCSENKCVPFAKQARLKWGSEVPRGGLA